MEMNLTRFKTHNLLWKYALNEYFPEMKASHQRPSELQLDV